MGKDVNFPRRTDITFGPLVYMISNKKTKQKNKNKKQYI